MATLVENRQAAQLAQRAESLIRALVHLRVQLSGAEQSRRRASNSDERAIAAARLAQLEEKRQPLKDGFLRLAREATGEEFAAAMQTGMMALRAQ
jgi:hypothetical protein